MQDPDPYISYKELIRQGWFNKKIDELENILAVLHADGKLTGEEVQHLLKMARDKRSEDTTPLRR